MALSVRMAFESDSYNCVTEKLQKHTHVELAKFKYIAFISIGCLLESTLT